MKLFETNFSKEKPELIAAPVLLSTFKFQMRTNQIYTAYVSWGSDGKRRPVLIVEDKNKNVFCYRITSKYKNKSERIKKNYFPLMDWKIEGLDKQSYIDVGDIIKLSKEHVSFRLVGELSIRDIEALVEFIRNRYEI